MSDNEFFLMKHGSDLHDSYPDYPVILSKNIPVQDSCIRGTTLY